MKILVATDGSPHSTAAVEEVARRPWPLGSEVRVVSVADMTPMLTGDWSLHPTVYEEYRSECVRIAKQTIERAVARLEDAANGRYTVSSELLEGNPKREILNAAEEWHADLVVVGSHGRGAVLRLLLGSVSSAIVHHANCSVEIIRPRPSPSA